MIDLIYSEKRAIELKEKYDIKFNKLYKSFTENNKEIKQKAKGIFFIVLSLICAVCTFMRILKNLETILLSDDLAEGLLLIGLFSTSLVIFLFSVLYTIDIYDAQKTNRYNYINKKGRYTYPLLVRFYNEFVDKKILKLEIVEEDENFNTKLLQVIYEDKNGIIDKTDFRLKYNECNSVDMITVDIEKGLILLPAKKVETNFIIKEKIND